MRPWNFGADVPAVPDVPGAIAPLLLPVAQARATALATRARLALPDTQAPIGAPGLRIRTLGRFAVEIAGRLRLEEGSRARKATTLFKYLLTYSERSVPTAEVLDLLWPEVPEDLAATALRSLLRQLRLALGYSSHDETCLRHTSRTLTLHLSRDDWWDVLAFNTSLAEARRRQRAGDREGALDAYAAGVTLYAGDYLEEDGVASWVRPSREHLREEWLAALSAMAALHGERGEEEQQEALLRTILRADPYREPCHRALMRLFMAQGRGAEALVLYRQLEDLLRIEFGASPDPRTQALLSHATQPALAD